MSISRRYFLELGIKGVITIGAGNMLQSFTSQNFILPAPDAIQLRFAIASDGHFGQELSDYEAMHTDMVQWLNKERTTRGVDFTMINGDIFHDDESLMTAAKSYWDKLSMPYYVSHGNHDMTDESNWQQAFKYPWNYHFAIDDNAFIVLNSSDVNGEYICPDITWAQEQLDRFANKKKLFVFMHITPFSWTKGGLPCPDLVSLFDKQDNLKAIFNGHDHNHDEMKLNNGKCYFFDSHIGGNWGTDYRGYRIVEVLKDGNILTYQVNPFKKDPVNCNKL